MKKPDQELALAGSRLRMGRGGGRGQGSTSAHEHPDRGRRVGEQPGGAHHFRRAGESHRASRDEESRRWDRVRPAGRVGVETGAFESVGLAAAERTVMRRRARLLSAIGLACSRGQQRVDPLWGSLWQRSVSMVLFPVDEASLLFVDNRLIFVASRWFG